jgi:hypothetical protein
MKRGADARYADRMAERIKVKTERREKGFPETGNIYGEFTKRKSRAERGNNYQDEIQQISSNNPEEIPIGDETFAGAGSSIQVQPVELRRQARGIARKTPRWQPRGDDTQSFRPLVQEERGVLRVRLLALSTRVNTLFRLRQQKCG